MIEYKPESNHLPRVTSAAEGTVSLTWLWEVVVRTKKLPDNLDAQLLFIVLRDRLRNPEKEVRQHALRVLADLIPAIPQESLNQHMELILPELMLNLSHVAPSVRKGSVDVLRIFLKHSSEPNEVLKKILTSVPQDSHLMLGLLMAAPYFSNLQISEEALIFLVNQLFQGTSQELLKETSICALVKVRRRIGVERFNNVIGDDPLRKFLEMCNENNIDLALKKHDNVILETEISLESGPGIIMKIHEETDKSDVESEMATKSPRKVHFGGEVVKMRTPESDSSPHSSDDNEIQTSLVIDNPTSIKITLNNGIASIKTRHRSMIPVRIKSESNPSTPRKKVQAKRRLHKSAPELRKTQFSKIPIKNDSKKFKEKLHENNNLLVHSEVEMFHNLSRSPARSPQPELLEDEITYPSFQVFKEDDGQHPFGSIVNDLISKRDIWTQSRALDDLIMILSKGNLQFNSTSITQLFGALFGCEKQQRLQSRAQEALKMVLSTIDTQTLHESMPQISNEIVKMNPPARVRLGLVVMERSSPKIFFESLKIGDDREGMLQVLIAAARTFPSSELDVTKGAQLAFEAMKDSKRAVRQAALEALASLAQVAGNTTILNNVSELYSDDSEQLMRIVRTRLSRRQLPIVDFNGNIRYSSPREQEEFDWLCGGAVLSKTMSLNSIQVPNNNYWRNNPRHNFVGSPSVGNENSEDAKKDENWNNAEKVPEGVSLSPVYVLHRDSPQVNGKNYKNYDRGRSNSPPRNNNEARKLFRQNIQFRKSFSTEYIYSSGVKLQEPTSLSLSSRSSTTSTSSSSRSGIWLREFRSGIPIPIQSDSKFKIRHRYSSDFHSGPLLAQEPINRTKLESPEKPPPQQVFTQALPPPSSGSESSGYFTPPAEHHLKEERFVPEEKQDFSSEEPNFEIVSESFEVADPEVLRESSADSSFEVNERVEDLAQETPKILSPLDEVDFTTPQIFSDSKKKSRSEVDLKSSLPEIERKSVNSAPPINDLVAVVPYRFVESPVKISLPGSVASKDNTPTKTVEKCPRIFLKRTLSTKVAVSKRSAETPQDEVRPFTRPKEAFVQTLVQMESNDWENVLLGLNSLIRLCHHHSDILELHMHQVCQALSKNIRNLRSQVARAACRASIELFASCRKGLDSELEELAGPLLQRTADTNKFLRSDANAALDAMSYNMPLPRVVPVIAHKGSTHQNCVVRATTTRLLSDMTMRLGPEKVFQLPKEIRDKFLLIGANGLTEGSLDSRKYAKTLMGSLVKHPQFQSSLLGAVPQHTIRHISKAIKCLK